MGKIYTALGLMSGTSMDGVDASIIQSDGKSNYKAILDRYFEYPKDKDPREDIFKYAVKSKWVILKMMPQTTNLEDIFRNLTSSGASNE